MFPSKSLLLSILIVVSFVIIILASLTLKLNSNYLTNSSQSPSRNVENTNQGTSNSNTGTIEFLEQPFLNERIAWTQKEVTFNLPLSHTNSKSNKEYYLKIAGKNWTSSSVKDEINGINPLQEQYQEMYAWANQSEPLPTLYQFEFVPLAANGTNRIYTLDGVIVRKGSKIQVLVYEFNIPKKYYLQSQNEPISVKTPFAEEYSIFLSEPIEITNLEQQTQSLLEI